MTSNHLTPPDTERGNTDNPLGTHTRPYKNWFFTWNNYPDTFDTDLSTYFNTAIKYAYQEEIGENGTKHIQGCVSFKNARHLSALKKLHPGIHWEKTKDMKAAITYCTKMETRNGIVKTRGIPKPIKDPLEDIKMKPWQEELIEIIKQDPHPRQILWRWDKVGNTGKTTFAKHLCIKYEALYVLGKSNDIKSAIASFIGEEKEIKIVIWDIPRTQEDYVSYSAIEEIKNGICFSGKYESKQLIFNIPHVIIFANFEPIRGHLSADRWNIKEIY